MTGELKSMFESHLGADSTMANADGISEKQRIEMEEKRKKDFIKRQSKQNDFNFSAAGLKREFIKLVGGIPSMVPTGPSKPLDKHSRVTSWVWSKFNNPARSDHFHLSHWQRQEDVDKDYEYAQFNKKINLVEFTKEEYDEGIVDMDPYWSYEETCYLWDLCRRFDLRFIVIHDQYDSQYNRTIEELKDRYYSVSRKILERNKNLEHPIIKSGYNYEHEMKRRAYIERSINKSKEESNQEVELLKQAEDVENRLEKYQKIEKVEKNLLENNRPNVNFEEFIKLNANQEDSFVYTRSQKLKYNLPISEKLQKKVDLFLKELSIPEKLTPTVRVEQAYDTLRNSLIILTSLKKHLEKKEKEMALLQQKQHELQNKLPAQRIAVANNIININTGGLVGPDSMDMLSVSSTSKDISKKNTNLNKTRKRKANDDQDIEENPSAKKRKKLTGLPKN